MAIAFVHPREGLASYAGGKLYFYNPGTVTARNVYQDADLTSLHTQPVIADADGVFAAIYLQPGTFKVRFEQATGVLVYEQDNVDPGVGTGPGALPISSGGTSATNAVTARTNLGAASATDLTSAQGNISIIQSQITPSLVGGTRLGLLAGRDTVRAVDLDDGEFGQIIAQRFFTTIQGPRTTTTVIPGDNTIPQIGEGTEIWSQAITPRFSNSKIRVRAVFQVGSVNAVTTALALFDGATDAVAMASAAIGSTTICSIVLDHEFSSWGLTTKTLSIRYGPSAGTAYLNRDNGTGPQYGGLITSSVETIEIKGGPF